MKPQATEKGLSRREVLSIVIAVPSTFTQDSSIRPSGVGAADGPTQAADRSDSPAETKWRARGRSDALRGYYRPVRDRLSFPLGEDRAEAEVEYERAYWDTLRLSR